MNPAARYPRVAQASRTRLPLATRVARARVEPAGGFSRSRSALPMDQK
jgi:hypothetical protein